MVSKPRPVFAPVMRTIGLLLIMDVVSILVVVFVRSKLNFRILSEKGDGGTIYVYVFKLSPHRLVRA